MIMTKPYLWLLFLRPAWGECVCGTHRSADHRLTFHHWTPGLAFPTDTSGAGVGGPLLALPVGAAFPGAGLWHTAQSKHGGKWNQVTGSEPEIQEWRCGIAESTHSWNQNLSLTEDQQKTEILSKNDPSIDGGQPTSHLPGYSPASSCCVAAAFPMLFYIAVVFKKVPQLDKKWFYLMGFPQRSVGKHIRGL